MATTLSSPNARAAGTPRHDRRRGDPVGVRVRRVAVVAAALVLTVTAVAYVNAMTTASNTALGVRSVEWLRDNGAVSIVATVENWYYSLTAPSKGGAGLKALPKVGDAAAANRTTPATTTGHGRRTSTSHRSHPTRRVVAHARPRQVRPILHPALPGEGIWEPSRAGLGSSSPLMVTTLRNEPDYPRVVVGLAWIDTHRTQTLLYPGRLEPSVALPTRGAMDVPTGRRDRLLATFNSGFKLIDAGGSLGVGGYTLHGHTYSPMHDGLATFEAYYDGRVNILDWTHGRAAPPTVMYARQNLPLLVDHGRPNPAIENANLWGATVGNATLVWRSGIGIDRRGNLIYAAGNDQTASSLASALIRAGAIRAMELDINSYWVSFITYGGWGALRAANLMPDMNRVATRYLTPDDRDFFAVYLRRQSLR
jgi:hypothetical protein